MPNRIVLFYSNRRPEDAPFLAELQSLEKDNPRYKLIASMTEMEKSHQTWNGETGLINQYRWMDKANDVVEIPIDKAMDIVIQTNGNPPATQPSGGSK